MGSLACSPDFTTFARYRPARTHTHVHPIRLLSTKGMYTLKPPIGSSPLLCSSRVLKFTRYSFSQRYYIICDDCSSRIV